MENNTYTRLEANFLGKVDKCARKARLHKTMLCQTQEKMSEFLSKNGDGLLHKLSRSDFKYYLMLQEEVNRHKILFYFHSSRVSRILSRYYRGYNLTRYFTKKTKELYIEALEMTKDLKGCKEDI